ncbi:RAN guanine nucleotide release [Musa troglodytarum]|uniref:RAN guanine nucleotide release n=1 Tax=Musa troglodytarum TaxID=320322 RepID=A0A9E7HIW4_9LILI|nr:RAN guanine nucleotide release [Musa troglodytarum]
MTCAHYSQQADLFFGTSSKMNGEDCVQRPLFGGAISSCFPLRFQDVSNIREVPDHQEVFADPDQDGSLIFELLDLKHEVGDGGSAVWFLQDIAREQDAEETMHSGTLEAVGLTSLNGPAIVTTAVSQMAKDGLSISCRVHIFSWPLQREGKEERHTIWSGWFIWQICVSTDVVITAYEPILINPEMLPQEDDLRAQVAALTGMYVVNQLHINSWTNDDEITGCFASHCDAHI